MSTNYVESSLKRFLKRKVKVTFGLVVAFMITGTVGFAEENPYREGTIEYHKWEAEKALEGTFLNGAGTNNLGSINGKTDNGYTLEITSDADGNNTIKVEGLIKDSVTVPNKYISNNVLKNLGELNSEKSTDTDNYGTIKYSSKLVNNYGIIEGNNQNVTNNYGMILGNVSSNNGYNYGYISAGQTISSGTGYNYGIINGTQLSQNGGTVNNYGMINVSDYRGQKTVSGGEAYNYGYIYAPKGWVQIAESEGGSTYNYGILAANANDTQIIHQLNSPEAKGYNYGVVVQMAKDGANQTSIYAGENTIDRGIIFSTTGVSVYKFEKNNIDGVVLTADFSNKKIENITFVSKDTIKDENGNVINKNVVNLTDKQDNDRKVNDVFTNDSTKTTVYTQNKTAEITGDLNDDLAGKTLTGVVDTNAGDNTTLYKFEGDNLVLNDTVITGYFQKAGTLLDVTDTKLVIGGGTVINAVQETFDTGATAVKLGENGTLTIVGKGQVIGKIDGGKKDNTTVENIAMQDTSETLDITAQTLILRNAESDIEKTLVKDGENYTDVTYKNLDVEEMKLNFVTDNDKINKIVINGNSEIGTINGSKSTEKIEMTIDSTENIGNISLGQNDDILNITNSKHSGVIDLGTGTDTFNLTKINTGADHIATAENTFNYKVNNAETVTLTGGGWHIGKDAQFNNSVGGVDRPEMELAVTNKGTLHIEMLKGENGNVVSTSFDELIKGADIKLTTDDSSSIKYIIGKGFDLQQREYNLAKYYDISGVKNVEASVIFDVETTNEGKDVKLTVKSADDFGLGNYKGIYEAVLGRLPENDDLRNAVNNQDKTEFVDMIRTADDTAEAFYTTGYAVTKDVTDTYMSVVEDFGRKAGKGEWIAYGKYVNTDSEFDGGKASRGYDGDITGTVGMLEYGVNNTTSYGAVFGMGDTEVDINGGGKLDGDNTYFGAYVKHRTQSGIDLLGNIGFTKSELDLNLATETTVGDVDYHIITDGSSDADALTFSLKGRKDYRISDSVILQPVAGLRYSLISQDAVESRNANFRIDEQDVTIFEGTVGGNIIKEFDISNGKLALMAGAEFVLTEVSNSDDARYTLYEQNIELTGEEDIADNRVEAHVGAEYIHENGVGVDVKYEFVWTDKGDSDRITAGISYRF